MKAQFVALYCGCLSPVTLYFGPATRAELEEIFKQRGFKKSLRPGIWVRFKPRTEQVAIRRLYKATRLV